MSYVTPVLFLLRLANGLVGILDRECEIGILFFNTVKFVKFVGPADRNLKGNTGCFLVRVSQ